MSQQPDPLTLGPHAVYATMRTDDLKTVLKRQPSAVAKQAVKLELLKRRRAHGPNG